MKSIICLLSLSFLISCGSDEDLNSSRLLSQNITSDTSSDSWQSESVYYPLTQTTDCVLMSGQCGGVYVFPTRTTAAKEVRANLHATIDNDPWIAIGVLNGPDRLSFNCKFQVCSQANNICASHSLEKDLSNVYWQNGPENGVTVNQTDNPKEKDFEITHTIPANSNFRVFCHYHWFLDQADGTPPRITRFDMR